MNLYHVKSYFAQEGILEIPVPASKSILNRALLLATLARGNVFVRCGALSDDTRTMLECLRMLGIIIDETVDGLLVHGSGGAFSHLYDAIVPIIDVRSAGTVARFLPAVLAVRGGKYRFTASEQLKKRPMEILHALENAGVEFQFEGEPYHYPFSMHSVGLTKNYFTVDTFESTQYASGLLIAASAGKSPVTLKLTGPRTSGSYLKITLDMLKAFHIPVKENGDEITVYPAENPPTEYTVESDLSGACYFYALSLLFGAKIFIRGTKLDTIQGDSRFLRMLEEKGVKLLETSEGLLADGTAVKSYSGFDLDMRDFSDQTLTVAALAPFATTPSILRNVGHIQYQECDRIRAIVENLNALGVPARSDGENIEISPAKPKNGVVKTFDDHRVAMAFSLIGLKNGGISIENPNCCKKTFENFFDILSQITNHNL